MSRAVHPRWWVRVLLVYFAARGISAILFVLIARTQEANLWTDAAPSYLQWTGLMWDSSWYRTIAEQGYPSGLPLAADGRVAQNAWAFFPLYPGLVSGVQWMSGAGWADTAPLVSLALGAAAMLLVHQSVAVAVQSGGLGTSGRFFGVPMPTTGEDLPEQVRTHAPLATVSLLSTSISAPTLQVAYTESLGLLAVAGAIWAIQTRRYPIAAVAVIVAGMSRAVALPLAGVVIVHTLVRWRAPQTDRIDRVSGVVVAVTAVAAGLAWPLAVGLLTGRADAYLLTQGAWRARGEVIPLVPWLDVARWLAGSWAIVALAAVAIAVIGGLLSRPMRQVGPELYGWTVSYVAYLVWVLEPGTSLVRFALMAYPVWFALAVAALSSRHPRHWLAALILLGVAGQAAWIGLLWRLVPPAGWPP